MSYIVHVCRRTSVLKETRPILFQSLQIILFCFFCLFAYFFFFTHYFVYDIIINK